MLFLIVFIIPIREHFSEDHYLIKEVKGVLLYR